MISRGEVWWTTLAPPVGSEPGFRRPVVVAQADSYNRSRLNTVLVIAMTSNLDRANDPGNVLVRNQESGLDRHSVINVTNIIALDRSVLERRVGALPAYLIERVDAGLRRVLGL